MRANKWDEYLRMSECTTWDTVYKFPKAITLVYGEQYSCKPNINDVHQLYTVHDNKHGFLGILGSIDFMHW